jgi:Family of unknown function (DUF5519)
MSALVHPLKQLLLDDLARIEGLEARPSPVAGGTALFHHGREFAHFHHDTELDLRLGAARIRALGLVHPAGSVQHPARKPSSPWIELRYASADDVQRVAELVRLSLS